MSDAEAITEGLVLGDLFVERHHLAHHGLELCAIKRGSMPAEALRVESWTQLHEGKAAAQRVVKHREAAVRRVHHADDVDVRGHAEQLVGVKQLKLIPALIVFDEHEQLAENLGKIAAVDLVNDEEVVVLLIVGGLFTERVEGALDQLESHAGRTVALDEVFVGVALVELHQLDTRNVFHTHHRVSKTLSDESLADARRALQDDVLLGAQ